MTEDLLERRIAESLERRAHDAEPGSRRFADVEGRAARHRRARARGIGAMALASTVLVVVGIVAAAGLRTDERSLTVGPADDPSATVATPSLLGDAWPVLAGVEPTRADPPFETVSGLQPSTPGMGDTEIAPYVYVGPRTERALVYELTGERWTSTVAWTDLPSGGTATATSITGTGFDPDRFDEVENTSGSYEAIDSSFVPPDLDLGRMSARPEELLQAPDSRPVELPVEHHGLFDWVVLPEVCSPAGDHCRTTAVGGDPMRLVVVDLATPGEVDVRSMLATIELRPADQVALTPPADPNGPLGVGNGPDTPPAAWGASPFFVIRLPLVPDDSVWPADVPADYCTAFRQWKQIQMDHLEAFGTPGWIRWARALAELAPTELTDEFTVAADEQAAGRDASASERGSLAIGTLAAEGDAGCPA